MPSRTRTSNVHAAQWSPNGGSLGQADLTQLFLGHPPDRGDLVGQLQGNLWRVRNGLQARVGDDEGGGIVYGHGLAS